MKVVTDKTFEEFVLKSQKPVVVDVYADWCGPCKTIAPIMEELASENTNIEFFKCNIDENPEVATKYGIRSIPLVLFFNKGKLVGNQLGAYPKYSFQNKINVLYENA